MTIEVDQCETMEKDLKEEHGDDFLTNRENFPITSQLLSMLAGTPCKRHFGYNDLVKEYCSDIKNFTEQIGGGQTCANRADSSMRSEWCLNEKERIKTDSKCTKEQLGNAYDSMASKFCKRIQRISGVHVTILKIKYVPQILPPKGVNITNNWTKIRNILKMGTLF